MITDDSASVMGVCSLGSGPIEKIFNFRTCACPFTNHPPRQPVMLSGSEASKIPPNQPPWSHTSLCRETKAAQPW